MLTRDLPKDPTSHAIVPSNVQLVLAEGAEGPLSLVLPPLDDLLHVSEIKDSQFSLSEWTTARAEDTEARFRHQLAELKVKLKRFEQSPTLLNRLANLAGGVGDYQEEAAFLARARTSSQSPLFVHRQAENLLRQNQLQGAEALFASLDLDRDLDANLKLATFLIRRGALEEAQARVAKAISLDPTSFSARLFEGGLALWRGDFAHAIHAFRIAAEERPNSAVLQTNLAIAYIRLGQRSKAVSALKLAVAFEPLNKNSVFLLSDLANELKCDEDAIPSLRYFLVFEQRDAGGWSRLARALMKLNQPAEALDALRRQASIDESSAVWNNIGVAHHALKDESRAIRAFKYAMDLSADRQDESYYLAARNAALHFLRHRRSEEALKVTTAIIAADNRRVGLRSPVLSDIYAFHLTLLRRTERSGEFERLGLSLLSEKDASERLKIWVLGNLISALGIAEESLDRALRLIAENRNWIDSLSASAGERVVTLFNNVAFALAESGNLVDAEVYLRRIQSALHRHPYPTATLGLIDFRKGNVSRAIARYREAIRLAGDRSDKARIRQKLNLEVGTYWSGRSASKARTYLQRAASMTDGEPALARAARARLLRIGHG